MGPAVARLPVAEIAVPDILAVLRRNGEDIYDREVRPRVPFGNGPGSQLARAIHCRTQRPSAAPWARSMSPVQRP
jgi:hypothetical protein